MYVKAYKLQYKSNILPDSDEGSDNDNYRYDDNGDKFFI